MSSPSYWTRAQTFSRSATLKLYCSYALSTWAERLWQFALSLALMKIRNDLQLIAINGLVNGLAVLFFASTVGRWIDETKRITAARITLTLTNGSVALSAICLTAILYWEADISHIWNGNLRLVIIVLAILLSTISILSQTGTKIVLTKDWVVVMCNNEKDRLADMNAWLLRIDLAATILSPLKAGLLITLVSESACCLFIAAWTICSWFVEFWLLNVVYQSVPALAVKKSTEVALENMHPSAAVGLLAPESSGTVENPDAALDRKPVAVPEEKCCAKFDSVLTSTITGWRSYYRQAVFPAAFSLALLYLTVLDFDGITTGYASSQGLRADVLAVARGIGALMGILGSIIYPISRSKIGLIRTGLVSFILELLCLALCVLSIWLPGSHFDPIGYFTSAGNTSIANPLLNTTVGVLNVSTEAAATEFSDSGYSYCSIWTFLLGVVLARCGLWMADLSITQIMQESIAEHERGVVNGVQSSANQLLSMIKDFLVIVLPDQRTFGLLIIVSWLSILLGFLTYSVYSRRVRGHILPFHRQLSDLFCRQSGAPDRQDDVDK